MKIKIKIKQKSLYFFKASSAQGARHCSSVPRLLNERADALASTPLPSAKRVA